MQIYILLYQILFTIVNRVNSSNFGFLRAPPSPLLPPPLDLFADVNI